MRITLRCLGLELLHIDASTDDDAAEEYDEPGSTTSWPVGFTATHDLPDEAGLPQRWGDDEC